MTQNFNRRDVKYQTGLIGNPIQHSLSPFIHNSAFNELNMTDWSYDTYSVDRNNLELFIKNYSARFEGFNVTMPCKVDMVSYCDFLDDSAEQLGAVNTVKVIEGKLKGYNTDGFGFLKALDYHRVSYCNKKMCILGNGGAAKAIAYAAGKAGADIRILYRSTERNILEVLEDTDILVNATPVGMLDGDSPVSSFSRVSRNLFVADLIYRPAETRLLRMAKEEGLNYMNGLDMLFFQADLSFHIWTGKNISEKIHKSLYSI